MRQPAFHILLVAAITGANLSPTVAQTVLDKAAKDELAFVEDSDPVMRAAIRKAQSSLPEFLNLASTPRPSTSRFSVKVAVRDGDKVEYFWITPFQRKDDEFVGRLNNVPRSVRRVKVGELITFRNRDIVDWLYDDAGKMKGNFTACALLTHEPKEEADAFKKQFSLECEN